MSNQVTDLEITVEVKAVNDPQVLLTVSTTFQNPNKIFRFFRQMMILWEICHGVGAILVSPTQFFPYLHRASLSSEMRMGLTSIILCKMQSPFFPPMLQIYFCGWMLMITALYT